MLRNLHLAGLILSLIASAGRAETPSLSSASPMAALPGKSTVVTLHGANLSSAQAFWTSFPAKASLANAPSSTNDAREVSCRLTLPVDAPVGIGAIRVGTTNGVSGLLPFVVDDLPAIASTGTNRSVARAQVVVAPIAIDGSVEENGFDYYKFSARAGQQITVEVVARRLGSRMDPVMRLLDNRGRELAYSDDEPGLQGDSRFSYRFTAKGEYLLELRDINYAGGQEFRYHLRIGDFPAVFATFPLGGLQGHSSQFGFTGRGVERIKPVVAQIPSMVAGINLGARIPGGQSSAFATAIVSELEEYIEIEPNDSPETATKIKVPSAVNGRFSKAKDKDYYEFDAHKGEKLLFDAQTRSLGSMSEVFMRLLDSKGEILTETKFGDGKVPDPGEGSLTNSFSKDGTYRLLVEEAAQRGGPEYSYRVEIRPYAGFDLAAEVERVNVQVGGEFTVKINAVRRDLKEPIILTLNGLGEGFAIQDNVIAEGKTNATIKVKLPADAAPGTIQNFTIIGRAKSGDVESVALASTMPALKKIWNDAPYPPLALDGQIGLGISGSAVQEPPPPADTGRKKKKK